MGLSNFDKGTTNNFDYKDIAIAGSTQDVSSDTVSITFKNDINDADASAVIANNADVTTSGAAGRALFSLTAGSTNVPVKNYWYEVKWTLAGGDIYTIDRGQVIIQNKVYD